MTKQSANRLANRARVLYFIVPALMAVIILAIGSSISNDIADDAAHRMARQYSIEAASNFQVFMNPHMRLMQQMSYSVTIARWLANEYDLDAKAAAFESMMGYAVTWPSAYFMFTVYETLRGYDFNVDLTLDEFVPWGHLSGGEASQWFFDTRDAEMPYILNIQRTRPDEYGNWDLYIWSNHRIYYREQLVGVFTIGSPFADIYAATFGGFGDEGKRGYIIDRYGNVRLDSAGILEVVADGLPSFPPVPEAYDNPALQYGIERHLQMLCGGMFPLGTPTTEAIRLDTGEFRYASISSIIGTDWAVMVLSSLEYGIDPRYMPLIFITIALFVLYTFFGNILVREVNASQEKIKRIEIAEESNRAKSRFLARMSHEIRTPITAVLGISEIQLRSHSLSHHIEESFTKIHDSAQTLLGIVNDILDFSKIESDKLSIIEEEYESTSLINDVAQLHIMYLDYKNIAFQMKIDEDLPIQLVGDALRIRQIINNLMSNAFKYTDEGSITLSLKCEKRQDGQTVLVISVEDTGFGMTAEQLEALKTSEYLRFHEQEERFISGTGLGIPIVYSLVQMMNGQINFESETRKGTSVTVCIPQKIHVTEVLGKDVAKSLQNFEARSWSSTKKAEFVPEPMPYGKVLVIDDVDANLFVARGLFAFYDLSVETCTSGQAAIDSVKQGKVYDIIFMDHLMPNLSGIEAMKIIRGLGYKHPIVALTANALVGQAEEFMKIGFDGFISKPIQSLSLNEVLVKFIRDKQPPEVIAQAQEMTKRNTELDKIDNFLNREDIAEKLKLDVAKRHKNTFSDIEQALGTGNIEAAHRISHTLKGSAGLIGEDMLAQVAGDMERVLENREMPSSDQLSALKNELDRVIDSIDTQKIPATPIQQSKEETLALLDQLEPLLLGKNAGSLSLIDELRSIPEAALLVRQVEDFDFNVAVQSMETLRLLLQD